MLKLKRCWQVSLLLPRPRASPRAGTNAEGYDRFTHDQTGAVFVKLPGNETLAPFLIAENEVTQAEYEAVMAGHPTLDATPSFFDGTGDWEGTPINPPLDRDRLPVEGLSWDDVHAPDGFLARTGLELPTDAQWEYACRGGTTTEFFWGDECADVSYDLCIPAVDYMW